MPASCCAVNCQSRNTKLCTLSFHKFPFSDTDLLKKWKSAVKRKKWEPKKESSVLCSLHFEDSCFKSDLIPHRLGKTYEERKKSVLRKRKVLKKDAVPTIFDYNSKVPPKKARRVLNRLPILSSQSSTSVQTSHELPFANTETNKGSSESDTDSAPETVELEKKLRSKGIQVNR
jgi:hypothetical protein